MSSKKITSLQNERQKRGKPTESWRRGIYAMLLPIRKAGRIVRLHRRQK